MALQLLYDEEGHSLKERLREIDEQGQERTDAAKEELAALQTAIEQANTEVQALASRLTELIETQRTSFQAEATSRTQSFDAEIETLREQAKEQATELARLSKEAQDEQSVRADEHLASLADKEDRTRRLLDATSRPAIAGDYGKWSARQAKAASISTVLAVVIGLATAAALLYALDGASNDSLQFTLYKTGISVVGLIIAGYCARQAAEHRREERAAKRLHLDLNALEPFLENVDNPQELRTEIARRIFVPQQPKQQESLPRFAFRRGLNITETDASSTAPGSCTRQRPSSRPAEGRPCGGAHLRLGGGATTRGKCRSSCHLPRAAATGTTRDHVVGTTGSETPPIR